jgi:prolyl oligopeptidase PreP (S9A serine peptidase family)
MWALNHTTEWLQGLDSKTKDQLMREARMSKQEQRIQFLCRRTDIRQQRLLRRGMLTETAVEKEHRDRVRKDGLMQELEKTGGLWRTVDDVDTCKTATKYNILVHGRNSVYFQQ